jgi:choline dehydrogenase-like flavoprotein
MVEAVKGIQEFLTATPFQDYVVAASDGLESALTDNDLIQYVMDHSRTIQHPTGTAAMTAKDADYGVVDPDLLVKNVSGLRIVDASVLVSNTLCLSKCCWFDILAAFCPECTPHGRRLRFC